MTKIIPSPAPNIGLEWLQPQTVFSLIGVIGLIVGGLFALFKYVKSRQRKEISYSIISDFLLANIQDNISSRDIKLTVDTKKVNNIRFITLRIRNTGNMPIEQDDYNKALWFLPKVVIDNGNLIDAQVAGTQPEGISTSTTIDDEGRVAITNTLLNSGDSIFINILLSDYQEIIKVNGRVSGVKEIKPELFVAKQPFNISNFIGQMIVVLVLCGGLSFILSAALFFFQGISFINTFIIIALTLIVAFVVVYLFMKFKASMHR